MVNIVSDYFVIETPVEELKDIPRRIEKAARTCYKSEGMVGPGSDLRLLKKLVNMNHFSMIEFGGFIVVRFIVDRGLTHEIRTHRLSSYAMESTRYCNYSKGTFGSEITVSPMLDGLTEAQKQRRIELYEHCERVYMEELKEGIKPQQARDNLPTCTKAEILVAANVRQWTHVFKLRCSDAAHPKLRQIMRELRDELRKVVPIVFDD